MLTPRPRAELTVLTLPPLETDHVSRVPLEPWHGRLGPEPAGGGGAVGRNRRRFPADFAFRLTTAEHAALLSRNVIPRAEGRGGRRGAPVAFTEQGVAMLSSALRSDRAIDVNVAIMRAFVRLRGALAGHADLLRRIDAVEGRVGAHDAQLRAVFQAIRKLVDGPPVPERRRIGFCERD